MSKHNCPKCSFSAVPKERPKTVKVRIAVVVNERGRWAATGWAVDRGQADDKSMLDSACVMLDEVGHEQHYFIEAELPIPEPKTVEGMVVE